MKNNTYTRIKITGLTMFSNYLVCCLKNLVSKDKIKKIFVSETNERNLNRKIIGNSNGLILVPLRGGKKKRKKKNYTKPKKIKHIRKKTKLKVLTYYSVSEGFVTKLRKDSPESPGCFMAEHGDRLTCGKTGITFIRNSV